MAYDDNAIEAYEKLKRFPKLIEVLREHRAETGGNKPEDRLLMPYANAPKRQTHAWKRGDSS